MKKSKEEINNEKIKIKASMDGKPNNIVVIVNEYNKLKNQNEDKILVIEHL